VRFHCRAIPSIGYYKTKQNLRYAHSKRQDELGKVLKRTGANIAYVSGSLGHADQKTTENYLASFEKNERIKNAALLTKF